MNLYLFPESAVKTNGYGIAIISDYSTLTPSYDDIVIWYTNESENIFYKEKDIIVKKPRKIAFSRLKNLLLNRVSIEISSSKLRFLKKEKIDNIFCGDVVFYRAIRELFPSKQINVRFHNCFSKILVRKRILGISLNALFNINLWSLYNLEKKIFLDKNANKMFISDSDLSFYRNITCHNDASILNIKFNLYRNNMKEENIKLNRKIVWFGGIESHKTQSICWFINDIFKEVRKKIPDMEFHLYGNNTKKFSNPINGIYGHGHYAGKEFPMKSNALFINPDIIGGGIKLKLITYLNEKVVFLSTPFGFEGYDKELIDGKYCIVKEPDRWTETIIRMFLN